MHKKILVTGGAGFIGSNYVHLIAQRYPETAILVLDKLTYAGNLENIQTFIDADRVQFFHGDIADKEFVFNLVKEQKESGAPIDCIINFAAETHVDRSNLDSSIFVQTNIVGTHNLLDAARHFGIPRFHQVSTDEVYGDLGDDSQDYFTEESQIAPNCPYAASKAAADLLVRSYFETYGMHNTITRCSNNYGPYQYPEKLIPYFFTLAESGKPLPLYGDGMNIRDWLYVTDHCEAIDLVVQKASAGEIYNIGGNNEKRNREIAERILTFLGKPDSLIQYVEDRLAHDRRYAIDASKIERELGWQPSLQFEEGIKRTFEWYNQNREWSSAAIKRAADWWAGERSRV
ncbi:dTDP-glucose 4,6-dehydratase [Candidatus Peregrinibacteria bacterium CG11_big_fil_rev_8_21_14_0_20_46_8]|nr:MAG: dTDP-glucose 4,6-dehydratase [Candidatus Peregrinibacteria bacterium CG11_big_fil_rev_8_21_14_0_20_46_8]